MLAMSDELKLTIMMMFVGDEVPESMKTKALQDLDIIMMSYEEGDAAFVVSSMLKKALKEEDTELLKKAMSYTESMARVNGVNTSDRLDAVSTALYEVSKKAMDKFIKEIESEEQIRMQMIKTLADEQLLPVYYEPGFIVFYEAVKNVLVACSVNESYSKQQLINMIDAIDYEALEAVHRFSEEHSVKFRFADLSYKRRQDKQYELKLEEY